MDLRVEKPNIILTGFMGTGKTTVGKLLAGRLGYEFVDTDELIQTQQGRSIPKIFAEVGEGAFRKMEADVAQQLATQRGLVIGTGGGLMLNPDNAAALSRTGHVFCLVASPLTILTRLKNDRNRPLLAGPNPAKRIVELLQQRADSYDHFPQVTTDNKTPEEIVKIVIDRVQAIT